MEVHVRLKRLGECTLLAMCDANLLGKTLKQGKIAFHIREEFYKGSLMHLEDAVSLIRQASIINLVGHKIVKKAVEEGWIHPDAILKIDGVPHAQILKV